VDDGEPVPLEPPGGVLGEVLGTVLGVPGEVVVSPPGGAVGGDADGARSPGRSPTRSVRDSVHPARTPAPMASAQIPVSNLFIATPLSDERRRQSEVQPKCHRALA
jgi:hypothetical protein